MLTTLLMIVIGGTPFGQIPANDRGEKPAVGTELKILARASWPYGQATPDAAKKGELAVIRSAAELTNRSPWNQLDAPPQAVEKMATAQVAKLLKVPDVDWKKQMLILVTAGPRSSGGWKVHIDAVKVVGKSVKVEYTITPPAGFATAAFTHPGEVVLVERFDGPVVFAESPKKPKKGE